MGLMCLALSLTNCQKAQIEEVNPSPEANFELFASPAVATDAAITRTTNDGLATKWATGDQINIFHAPAGSTTYTNDKAFTLKDTATGSFGGTVGALDGGSYDWYAFYPYTSQITTPANTSAGWVVVGGKTPQAQIQNGNNSRTHLSRGACPLFGIAKAVESSAVPSIEMNHLTSIIKVQVTNNSSEDLKVENVSFTGTEDIVGTYYINFAASPVGYKPSGNQYVSNTASLEVKNGEVISSGASADFYIAVKPFTAKTGTTLKLAVNGYEKPLKLTKDVSFTAGHIKTLWFDFDKKMETVEYTAIDDVTKLSDNSRVCIVAKNENKYYYLPASPTLDAKGGKIYGKEIEVVDNKISTKLDDASWTAKASGEQWAFFDGANYLYHAKGGASGTDLAIGSTSTYQWDITSHNVADKTFKIAAYNNGIKARGLLLNSSTFGGYALSNINNTGYYAIMLFVRTSDIPADKPIISSSDVASISARGVENQTLVYSISNGVDGAVLTAVGDGTVVTAMCENDAVTYTVAANKTASDREGTITLTYAKDGVTLTEKAIKVQQLAPVFKVSRASVELDATKGAQTTITVTSDFDWMADASASAGFSFSPNTYTWQEGGKETVTIIASNANASESGTATLGTITFSNFETKEKLIVTVTQKSSYVAPTTGKTVTITFNGGQGQKDGLTWESSPIKIVANTGEGSNNPNEHAKDKQLRFYAKNTLTISGATITKVEFAGTVQKFSANEGTVATDNTSWTGTSTNLVITNTAGSQAKLNSIKITYEE